MKNLEFFNEEEDSARIDAIFKLTALVMNKLASSYDEISAERYDELPKDVKDVFLSQLMMIHTFTSMAKPISYEWPGNTEEEAYENWIKSNLRKIMLGLNEDDIVDESEGTN